jgi:hypothetical protein
MMALKGCSCAPSDSHWYTVQNYTDQFWGQNEVPKTGWSQWGDAARANIVTRGANTRRRDNSLRGLRRVCYHGSLRKIED